jgi:hypothetical protein
VPFVVTFSLVLVLKVLADQRHGVLKDDLKLDAYPLDSLAVPYVNLNAVLI